MTRLIHYIKSITQQFKATIFFYGILLAGSISLMKFIEYRYLVGSLSIEIYIGIVATLFTALGIWVGLKLIGSQSHSKLSISPKAEVQQAIINKIGLSKREFEVLELIARGLSNQEIADQLYIALPTVKTHVSNLFDKLQVQRRTQAVLRARELNLIL